MCSRRKVSKIYVIPECTRCRRTLSKVQETFVRGSPNQHHTQSPSPRKYLVSGRGWLNSFSSGTICQRQFLSFEAFREGVQGRHGEVGVPLHFIHEVFEQQTCQRLYGEYVQSQEFITPCPNLRLMPNTAECLSLTPGKYSFIPSETSEFPSLECIYSETAQTGNTF